MFDFTSKALTNSLKGNLDDALKSGKVIVSIVIEGKEFPSKSYTRGLWSMLVDDNEIRISNIRTKKLFKQISVSDVKEVVFNVAKGFNNAPGQFMRQTLCFEIEMNVGENTYKFICEDIGAIKPILLWVQRNNLNYIDSDNLISIYNQNEPKEAVEILYNKLQELKGR